MSSRQQQSLFDFDDPPLDSPTPQPSAKEGHSAGNGVHQGQSPDSPTNGASSATLLKRPRDELSDPPPGMASGEKAKARDILNAIRTLKAIEREQRSATPEEKQQLIARIRDVVRAGPGKTAADPHVGHELFKKTCATCHTLFDEGGQTGPNLTGYERDNLDFMLLAMVDPSAAIREEFTQYQIALDDGRILTGLIVDQSPTTIVLRGANNQSTTLNKAEIEVLQAMSTSIMPDGLLEKLSDDEIRHLFSYLIRRTPLTN